MEIANSHIYTPPIRDMKTSVFDAMANEPFEPVKLSKDKDLIDYVALEYNKDPNYIMPARRFNNTFLAVLRSVHSTKLPLTNTWAKLGVGQASKITTLDYDTCFRDVQDICDGQSSINKLLQWKQFLLHFIALHVMTFDDLHLKYLNLLHLEAKDKNDELNAGLLKREQEEDRANDRPVREKRTERLDRHAEDKLKGYIDAFSAVNMNVVLLHLITSIQNALKPGVALNRLQLEADLDKLPRPPGFKNWREVEAAERKRKQKEIAEDDDWLD